MTPEELAKSVSDLVKKYVADALKPISDRIAEAEKGKIDPLELSKMVADTASKLLADIKPKDGNDGQDGRDAAYIDILPGINAEKSYPKGTFASHEGGIWFARKRTDGMEGWEPVVEGIKSVRIEKKGDRLFEIAVIKTSGGEEKLPFSSPTPIYRGTYKSGHEYEQGDTVTQSGAMWHCNEKTKESPGESKNWTLATKRGKDGKDFTPGKAVKIGAAA